MIDERDSSMVREAPQSSLRTAASRLRAQINVVVHDFHQRLRLLQCCESELLVQAVSIARGKAEAAQSLQIRMARDALHQPHAQALAAKFLQHVNVAKIRVGGAISHHPRQANLLRTLKQSEAERVRE